MNENAEIIAGLRRALEYREDTGELFWRERPREDFASNNAWAVWNSKHAGTKAGWRDSNGYVLVRILGKCRKASRVIWMMETGRVPDCVDHIDGDTGNNRFSNLRDVSHSMNMRNRRRSGQNASGCTGVYRMSGRSWAVQIDADGKRHYLGAYRDFDQAVLVRKAAEARLGFHENHDRIGRPGNQG